MSIFYGLPKIHKEGTPLRPIVSATNSVTYQIAKYIYSFWVHYSYGNLEHHVKDYTDYVSSVSDTCNEIMVAFDVESLESSCF